MSGQVFRTLIQVLSDTWNLALLYNSKWCVWALLLVGATNWGFFLSNFSRQQESIRAINCLPSHKLIPFPIGGATVYTQCDLLLLCWNPIFLANPFKRERGSILLSRNARACDKPDKPISTNLGLSWHDGGKKAISILRPFIVFWFVWSVAGEGMEMRKHYSHLIYQSQSTISPLPCQLLITYYIEGFVFVLAAFHLSKANEASPLSSVHLFTSPQHQQQFLMDLTIGKIYYT